MVKPVHQVLFKVSALFYLWPCGLDPLVLGVLFFFCWLHFFLAFFYLALFFNHPLVFGSHFFVSHLYSMVIS